MELLRCDPFSLSAENKKLLFSDALFEELRFHYTNNALYRSFCKKNEFNPYEFDGELGALPYIPAQIFKTIGNKLSSVDDQKLRFKLKSSATSGNPSIVTIDNETAKRQKIAMAKVMANVIGSQRRPFCIVDEVPSKSGVDNGEARRAAINGYLNFASKFEFFLKQEKDSDKYEFEEEKFKVWLKSLPPDEPIVIFGFTFLLHKFLFGDLTEKSIHFNLPRGSKIIHIGGWKKLENEKVSKAEFNSNLAGLFSISPDDVIDIYGFTEQMGLNYPDCPKGWKHIHSYAEVFCRNEKTLEVQPNGEEGLLQFISPIPHSYPGNIILTDDIGVIEDSLCGCGRDGRRFQVRGRAKKAEIRGCGDILGEKIIPAQAQKKQDQTVQTQFRLELPEKKFCNSEQEAIEELNRTINKLNRKRDWIASQPLECLIGLIDLARKEWQQIPELQRYRNVGLNFLVNWASPARLQKLLDASLRGKRGHIDMFLKRDDILTSSQRAYPVGLVSHWLAGNVPLLGMFALIQSILTKNVNLVKVPSGSVEVISLVLRSFARLKYTSPGGHTISGSDLLETIAVVYFDRNEHKVASVFSEAADARIAWGGGEAVKSISALPKKYNCQDIMFGPKLSSMVITSEVLDDPKHLRKTLKKAAIDASAFDQFACASPHTIYVQSGLEVTAEQFAHKLSEAMDKILNRLPIDTPDAPQAQKMRAKIALHDFIGRSWYDEGLRWAVLYSSELEMDSPTYWRTVTVREVKNIEDIYIYFNSDIQTVGLAGNSRQKLEVAHELQRRGVVRCPDIGMMTHFDSPWDGMFLADRLVRWGSLGGPI